MSYLMRTATILATIGALAAAIAIGVTQPARAQLQIDVTQGVVEPMPIAVTDFLASDQLGTDIANVVAADLRRSGLFAPIDRAAFIERISNPDVAPRFDDWRRTTRYVLATRRSSMIRSSPLPASSGSISARAALTSSNVGASRSTKVCSSP